MAMYAQIVGVIVPSKALEGETVNVTVQVKNLYNLGAITIAVTGGYNSTPLPSSVWTPSYAAVGVGKTQDFITSFIMPSQKITLGVYAYYGYDSNWQLDDQKYIPIALGTEEPPNGDGEGKIPWLALAGIGGIALLGIVLIRR